MKKRKLIQTNHLIQWELCVWIAIDVNQLVLFIKNYTNSNAFNYVCMIEQFKNSMRFFINFKIFYKAQ